MPCCSCQFPLAFLFPCCCWLSCPKWWIQELWDKCKVKVREIDDMVNISTRSAWMILQGKLVMKKFCLQWKNSNNEFSIQNAAYYCLLVIKTISGVGIWQWIKYGSTIWLHNRSDSQLSVVQQMKVARSFQKFNNQLAKTWH